MNLKSKIIVDRLKQVDLHQVERELFYVVCRDEVRSKIEDLITNGQKTNNSTNSHLLYALGVTDNLPTSTISIKSGSMPDVDYDLPSPARKELKNFLVETYGEDQVALIGTYSTLQAKGAIKEAIRVLKPHMSFEDVNNLTKKFFVIKPTDTELINETLENGLGMLHLNESAESFSDEKKYFLAALILEPDLRHWFLSDENKDVFDAVMSLLGAIKSTGVHAGGFVLSSDKIYNTVPCKWSEEHSIYITQPEMGHVEASGLIKFDFLGLKTLDEVGNAVKNIESLEKKHIDLTSIPRNDYQTLKSLTDGHTESVFQFSSKLSTDFLKRCKRVLSLNELAAVTAVLRPGPMGSEVHESFLKRLNGDEEVSYDHPLLKDILQETKGLIIYQEQVMQIASQIGGISGDRAAALIKAMGKKLQDKIDKEEGPFIKGATEKGIPERTAYSIWGKMKKFGEYGFNKSHASAYALMSYYCAYLKTNHKVSWIKAVLNTATDEDFRDYSSKWKEYLISPSVNLSGTEYRIITQDGHEKLVMPLTGVKGIGEAIAAPIVERAPYKDLNDFFTKNILADSKATGQRVIYSLIMSGCLDELVGQADGMSKTDLRKTIFLKYVEFKRANQKQSKTDEQQDRDLIRDVNSLSQEDFVVEELSLLSRSNFDFFEYFGDERLKYLSNGKPVLTPKDAQRARAGDAMYVFGSVKEVKTFKIKNGKMAGEDMHRITISHEDSDVEITVFPSNGNGMKKVIVNFPLLVNCKADEYNGRKSFVMVSATRPTLGLGKS